MKILLVKSTKSRDCSTHQKRYELKNFHSVDVLSSIWKTFVVSRLQDVDENIAVYARENLNCQSLIEIPYYSVKEYPIVCVYCGTKNNLIERNDKFLLQCVRSHKQP